MSDDEVVASDGPPRSLLDTSSHIYEGLSVSMPVRPSVGLFVRQHYSKTAENRPKWPKITLWLHTDLLRMHLIPRPVLFFFSVLIFTLMLLYSEQ